MQAPVLMILASLLFASMGVCVKYAAAWYSPGEIVFYRGLVGAGTIAIMTWRHGGSLRLGNQAEGGFIATLELPLPASA